MFYTVTFLRQYENASIVQLHIDREDRDVPTELPDMIQEYSILELVIKGGKIDYDCRFEQGSGSRGQTAYTYIVSPALPDDLSNIELVFKEYKTPYRTKPTGLEVHIKIDN